MSLLTTRRLSGSAAWRPWAIRGLILIAFVAGFLKLSQHPAAAPFKPPAHAEPGRPPSVASEGLSTRFVSPESGPHRHAGSLIELKDGRIRAFWFSGSQEGAPDVDIRSAVFAPSKRRWEGEASVIDRAATQAALWRYVKKLGNPVPARAADGRLHLFYVTVSLGGWAGSSISMITSDDEGQTWGPARRLVSSPFINVSTLVKGTPFLYADGRIGLPVYHEFIGNFGELLRIDGSGKVIDKQRLSHGRGSLQPVVLIQNAERAQVLMRHAGPSRPNRVIGTSTGDAGRHWTVAAKTSLPNPSAAVTGFALPEGPLLAVVNNIEANRDALSLMASTDGGKAWRTLATLEDQRAWRQGELVEADFVAASGTLVRTTDASLNDVESLVESARRHQCVRGRCSFEFSYPYLIRAANGDAHLVYTWNRSAIKHVSFSRQWLEQRLKALESGA